MHCDIDQVGSIEHIRQALEDIGVDRIDHGTNIVESQPWSTRSSAAGIGLTCCPVSNRFVTDDMKATEIAELLRDGVRVTVNSDDPAYFGGYVTENYLALAEHATLTSGEVITLAENSFLISWVDDDRRAGYLGEIGRYVEGYAP